MNSSNVNPWRKWIDITWLLIQVNLVSANIFRFAALFKVLPKYGVYNKYSQSSNAINSTEVDYSGQAQQYQNTLTLGITFFNLPSIFVGRVFLLILRVGSSLSASIWYSVFQILIDNNN
ncbi:unnamed protein product [Adineta steineri]|uniref:Uncharacterized protein n=1 Tax=Adineta steineri TaxID=433720 RepID=A0A818Q3N4_9BILA|nr:unnamed protein product [Adineta steineri]